MKNKILFIIAIILVVASVLFLNNILPCFTKLPAPGKAGEFGDQFGVLNTLFAGLAFLMIIVTLRQQNLSLRQQEEQIQLQRDDLILQRDEMQKQYKLTKIQQFESFFNTYFDIILKMKNNIYKDKLNNGGVDEDVVHSGYGIMNKILTGKKCPLTGKKCPLSDKECPLSKCELMWVIKGMIAKMRFYGDSLYTLFKYIMDDIYLDKDQKLLYLRILSNSLDDTENKIIYFYGIFSKYYDIVKYLYDNNILFKDNIIDCFLEGEILDYLRSHMNGERNIWLQSAQPIPEEK